MFTTYEAIPLEALTRRIAPRLFGEQEIPAEIQKVQFLIKTIDLSALKSEQIPVSESSLQ